jgi:hypothetical protein
MITIETIPHRFAKYWNEVKDIYLDFLNNEIF